MKAKKTRNLIIKLKDRKLQKAPFLKASPRKAAAANGAAVGKKAVAQKVPES